MNRGYVCLWRKSLDSGWIKNHKLWALWTYCLMKASHKEYDAIVGSQIVRLIPGQFIFGLHKASKETGLTIQEIRTAVALLKKAGNLTIKSTNKFSVITIINWCSYQVFDQEDNNQINKPITNKQQHTTIKSQNKENPGDFLELKKRYDTALLDRIFDALRTTRKTGRISDSIIKAQLTKWDIYPVEQVESGIRVFLEKGYASQGKAEAYLLGIIRGQHKAEMKKQSNPNRLPDWM